MKVATNLFVLANHRLACTLRTLHVISGFCQYQ